MPLRQCTHGIPIRSRLLAFQSTRTPLLVSGEVYPNDVAGQKPCESKKRGREGVPRGHDVASWKTVDKDLYPPPASEKQGTVSKWYSHGAAGFKAAAPDPRKARELPRLCIAGDVIAGPYNYLPLAERLDIDNLLAWLRENHEEWERVMPKGDHGTTYKDEPWNHYSPTRI